MTERAVGRREIVNPYLLLKDPQGAAAALITSAARLTRRKALQTLSVWALVELGLTSSGLPLSAAEATAPPEIKEIKDYERSLGRHRSYPWLPADESLEEPEASSTNEDGPWGKYDLLDRLINGKRARSDYWPKMGGYASTREWLISQNWNALHAKGDEYYWKVRAWAGYCLDGAAASYFAPKIEGPITIPIAGTEITFSEFDRLAVATMRYGGLARDPLDGEGIRERVKNGEPVVVNHSTDPNQEWWGLAREMKGDIVVITRTAKWNEIKENKLLTVTKHLPTINGAYLLYEDRGAQPGFEGNFAFVDRTVGGLIIGTHRSVA